MPNSQRRQAGFNLVELVISMCVLSILAAVAINNMRNYSRQARLSEVVLAAVPCKAAVQEAYPVRDTAPDAGGWECESTSGKTAYVGQVQTSSNGVIRVEVQNLDSRVNGRYVYLVPAQGDAATPLYTPNDLGRSVQGWICGSDWSVLRSSLPGNCRADTTTFSSDTFGP